MYTISYYTKVRVISLTKHYVFCLHQKNNENPKPPLHYQFCKTVISVTFKMKHSKLRREILHNYVFIYHKHRAEN